MKKTGKCPKCGSKDLYHSDRLHTWMGEGLSVTKGLKGVFTAGPRFEGIICRTCGFTEMYIPEKDLKKLK